MKIISDVNLPKGRKNVKQNIQQLNLGINDDEIINSSNTGFEVFQYKTVSQEDNPGNTIEGLKIEAFQQNNSGTCGQQNIIAMKNENQSEQMNPVHKKKIIKKQLIKQPCKTLESISSLTVELVKNKRGRKPKASLTLKKTSEKESQQFGKNTQQENTSSDDFSIEDLRKPLKNEFIQTGSNALPEQSKKTELSSQFQANHRSQMQFIEGDISQQDETFVPHFPKVQINGSMSSQENLFNRYEGTQHPCQHYNNNNSNNNVNNLFANMGSSKYFDHFQIDNSFLGDKHLDTFSRNANFNNSNHQLYQSNIHIYGSSSSLKCNFKNNCYDNSRMRFEHQNTFNNLLSCQEVGSFEYLQHSDGFKNDHQAFNRSYQLNCTRQNERDNNLLKASSSLTELERLNNPCFKIQDENSNDSNGNSSSKSFLRDNIFQNDNSFNHSKTYCFQQVLPNELEDKQQQILAMESSQMPDYFSKDEDLRRSQLSEYQHMNEGSLKVQDDLDICENKRHENDRKHLEIESLETDNCQIVVETHNDRDEQQIVKLDNKENQLSVSDYLEKENTDQVITQIEDNQMDYQSFIEKQVHKIDQKTQKLLEQQQQTQHESGTAEGSGVNYLEFSQVPRNAELLLVYKDYVIQFYPTKEAVYILKFQEGQLHGQNRKGWVNLKLKQKPEDNYLRKVKKAQVRTDGNRVYVVSIRAQTEILQIHELVHFKEKMYFIKCMEYDMILADLACSSIDNNFIYIYCVPKNEGDNIVMIQHEFSRQLKQVEKEDKSSTKVIHSKKMPKSFLILDSKVSGDSLLILYKEKQENNQERISKKKKQKKKSEEEEQQCEDGQNKESNVINNLTTISPDDRVQSKITEEKCENNNNLASVEEQSNQETVVKSKSSKKSLKLNLSCFRSGQCISETQFPGTRTSFSATIGNFESIFISSSDYGCLLLPPSSLLKPYSLILNPNLGKQINLLITSRSIVAVRQNGVEELFMENKSFQSSLFFCCQQEIISCYRTVNKIFLLIDDQSIWISSLAFAKKQGE